MPSHRLTGWMVAGLLTLGGPRSISAETPKDTAKSPPKSSPSKPPASSQDKHYTEMAQQFLAAAKARLQAEEQAKQDKQRAEELAKRERLRLRQRQQAEKLAKEMVVEKAKQQRAFDRAANQQLALARERQVKALYQKGLWLFQQGQYREAVEALQKMALLDPAHPLVKSAGQLITRAELKQFEQAARRTATAPPGKRDEMISELTKRLTEKRIEQETVVKYARSAIDERNYDTAIGLLYRVLKEDPMNRQAQQLMQQAQTAKLNQEQERLAHQVDLDEHHMVNDVLKAEVLPSDQLEKRRALPVSPTAVSAQSGSSPSVMAALKEPISFDFQDVSLTDVLDFLADAANVSIMPSPRLDLKQQRVSLKVDKLPLDLALDYLMKNQGLVYRADDGIILIATPEEFKDEPLETRVLFLRAGLGPFALETAAVEPNAALEMDPLKKLIEQSIPQPSGSKLVVDERSGSLIVTNTTENVKRIEQLLSQLDIAPLQVLIEARFVEMTLTELQQLGMESILSGNVALNKTGDAKNGSRDAANQIAKGGGVKFPALARKGEGLNLTLQGVLTGTQFESVLHLLEETQKSKTLSAPRVTTLNNQTASIKVVEEFRYPTRYEVSLVQFDINGDGDFDDAGETQFVNVPQDFQKRDIGILLNVTPSVGKDQKTITLVLAPEVSQFSQFRDLGGGVTVPEFTSSQLTTSVAMESGQTVVLGGLMKDSVSNQLTKIPVLGDLPLLGNLFRQRETSQTRKNLLIFVTARILAPRGPTT